MLQLSVLDKAHQDDKAVMQRLIVSRAALLSALEAMLTTVRSVIEGVRACERVETCCCVPVPEVM